MNTSQMLAVIICLCLGFGAFAGSASTVIGGPAPDFTLPDKDGGSHTLSKYRGKIVVLEWVNFDCPFVKKHYNSGNMQKLQAAYTAKGIVWLSICSSARGNQGYLTGKELEERLGMHKPKHTAYLIDADGVVGKSYDAKTTPHLFVIDTAGSLRYAGAIDDHPSTDPADIQGATNYIQAALDSLLEGKQIKVSVTASYGCSVKY